MTAKRVEDLELKELLASPVWEFTDANEDISETVVRPVTRLPVETLTGRIVANQVRLANGESRWAILGNIDAHNPRLTEHFLAVSVFDAGEWFHLARYHDPEAKERGPATLAAFLRLPIDSVFPIRYDVREYCTGDPVALSGSIPLEPRERLTRAQLIVLAVP